MRKVFKTNEILGIAGAGINVEKTNQKNLKISPVSDLGQFPSFRGECFFAFSGKFNIIFSENEFSQIALFITLWRLMSGAELSCWVMGNKDIDQLGCMIFPIVVSF